MPREGELMGISGRIVKCTAALITAFSLTFGGTAGVGGLCVTAAAEKPIPKTKEPVASVEPGTYDSNKYIRLTSSTRGARIFYTLDDSMPTLQSTEYTAPIRLKADPGETEFFTIRAIAVATGCEDSDVAEFEYCIEIPADKEVIYMELYRTPNRTRYSKGEKLDLTGGKIAVTYDDYTYDVLNITESMVSPFNSSTAGEKTVIVTYKEFTDRFTVTVREVSVGSGEVNYPDGDEILNDEQTDLRPTLDGTNAAGWEAIERGLSDKPKGASVTIHMNGSVNIPAAVLRAASAREQDITFTDESGMSWELDTTTLAVSSIPNIGLGIRTSAMNISKVVLNNVHGDVVKTMHINSDNKLGATLCVDVGKENSGRFVNLYKYDHDSRSISFVSTGKADILGGVGLLPKTGGDYIVAADDITGLPGDLDNSADLGLTDAVILLNMIVGLEEFTDVKTDVNGDDKVNAYDAAEILRRIIF